MSGMFKVARYAEAFSAGDDLSDINTFKAKHGPDPGEVIMPVRGEMVCAEALSDVQSGAGER
ncbi:hypothetical protein GCM10027276_39940 [Comamonas piscis]